MIDSFTSAAGLSGLLLFFAVLGSRNAGWGLVFFAAIGVIPAAAAWFELIVPKDLSLLQSPVVPALAFVVQVLVAWRLLRGPAKAKSPVAKGEGRFRTNPYYAAVSVLGVLIPAIAISLAQVMPRGNKPYGLFMIGLFLLVTILIPIGFCLRRRYSPPRVRWMRVNSVLIPISLGYLWLMNFGANFSL